MFTVMSLCHHTSSQVKSSRSTRTRISSGTAIDGWVSFSCIATYNNVWKAIM